MTKKNVPYSGQIELTIRCNAKCPFCSFHSLPESITGGEMNTEQIITLIDNIVELGVNALTFTGGEPTLRRDLPDIIYHTGVNHDLINGIATNGFLMPKLLKENKLKGLDYILTSIDYPTAAQHDQVRGIKVFNKVEEMIKLAYDQDIKVIVSTVVMKDNIHLLDQICQLTERWGCAAELFPCEDIIRDFPGKICQIVNIKDMIPNLPQWASTVRDLKKKYNHILTDEYSIQVVEQGGYGGAPDFYQNLLRCHVAESFLFIKHNGNIALPCKIHPVTCLSAFKYDLSKFYYAKEVREIMNKHDTYDFCDHCRLGCAIAASIPTSMKALYSKFIRGFLDGNLR